MRITILLLIVGVCIVSAKYLPYENESSVLLRNKRSNSEESNASVESDDDSSDKEDDNDSGEQQIDKQRRKKEEEQRKLEEKKAKELRKQEEKQQKEERKRLERIEKEKRKEEEKQRKLLEKHEKQERKKEEKRLKELEKLRKEVLEEKSDEDGFLETEEENSVELGNIWRNHIYVKYGLTLASTHAEKKAVLDRYLSEELGLNSNSTRSERQRAIVKLIETKLQNDTESKEALRNQLLSQINSVTINNLRNKLNKGIEKLTNKTQILNNVTLPWADVAQQNLEERKTFLQSISQFLSSVLPNWTTGTQNQNASVQQDVPANNNEVYNSEGNTVATSGINEVNADDSIVSNGVVLSSNSGIEGNPIIASIDINNNAASDASSLPSVTDTANSPTSSNPTEVQSSSGTGNIPAVQINVNTAVSSGLANDSNIASTDINNNAASDDSSILSISSDSANSPTASNVPEVQSTSGASNIPALEISVGTNVNHIATVPSGDGGIENDSNIASTNINNNAASDDSSILSISSDSANSPTASNVPEVQSTSGASNISAIEISVGTNVNHFATVPSGDSGIENDSNIASTNINNNAASDTSSVPSIINDTANLPEASNVAKVQSSIGASNIPAVGVSVGISVDSNTTVPSGDIGLENDSNIASQDINNNAASDTGSLPSIINDTAYLPEASNVAEVQSSFGASNIPAVGVSVDSNTVVPSGDIVIENDSNIVSQDINSNAASDASLVSPTSNDSGNSPDVQLSGASNIPDAEINVETSVVSNAVVPSGESNVVITSNQSDPNNIVIPGSIDATVVESQNTGISSSNAGVNKDLIKNQVDVSTTISTIGDSVADNLNNEVNRPVDSSNVIISASSDSNIVTNADVVPANVNEISTASTSSGANITANAVDSFSGVSSPGIKENNEVIVPSRPTLAKIGVNADESKSNIASEIIYSDVNSKNNGLNVENEPSVIKPVTDGEVTSGANVDVSNIGSSIVVVSSKDKSQSPDPIIGSTINDIQDSNNAENTNSVTSSSVGNLPVSDPIITTSVDSSGVLTKDIGVESNSNIASININNNVASDISPKPSISNDISTPPAASNPAEVQSSSGASNIPAVEINVGTTDSNNVVLSNSKIENLVNDVPVLPENSVTDSNNDNTSVSVNSDIKSTVNIIDMITTNAPLSNSVSILPEQNITDINNENVSVSSTRSVATDSGISLSQPDISMGINVVQNITITYPNSNNDMSGISNINESSPSVVNNVTVTTEPIILNTAHQTSEQDPSVLVEASTQANINKSPTMDLGVSTTGGEAINNVNTAPNDTITETSLSSTGSSAQSQDLQPLSTIIPVESSTSTQIDGITLPVEEGASVVEILPQL